jgi:hypothetical protein
VAITLNFLRNGAAGFIDWLDVLRNRMTPCELTSSVSNTEPSRTGAVSFRRVLGRPSRLLGEGLLQTSEQDKELERESLCPNEEKQKARTGSDGQDGIYD